jgi:hypothetical protein
VTNIQFGDTNTTHGTNSPIYISRQANVDPLRELVQAVEVMQARTSGQDRQVVDDFLSLANSTEDGGVERHRIREALLQIGGVATLVGQVGVPVIEAIQKVKEALGL